MADQSGKQPQKHRLVHDSPNAMRYNDQRSTSNDTTQASTHDTGTQGSGQSASEEGTTEADEEDSSGDQDDDQEDEEDDAEVPTPSRGRGKGKGKRPAIRVEPADEDESLEDVETTSHEAGNKTDTLSTNQIPNGSKKRTYSNLSSTSLLFGEDDGALAQFPRPKMLRKLSYSGGKGLLTYQKAPNGDDMNGSENAIESSDEENDKDDDDEDYSGVNMVSEEESDVELMEQQEEQFIIHEEQQHAIDLFSPEFDRSLTDRVTIAGYQSDDMFYYNPDGTNDPTTLEPPDHGFGPFFESNPVHSTPEPMSKRKYSDSSTKRVRFDDEVQVSNSPSSSSSELDSGAFPDLFMEQDKLPPNLHQLLQDDNDSENGDCPSSASEHSYWDVGQEEIRPTASRDFENFDDTSDSSGYESDLGDDLGDTTDEDSDIERHAPPPRTPQQKSVLRRPSSAPASRLSSPNPFQRISRPPLRGVFVHENSKEAIAVTNRVTKMLTFYRPRVCMSLRQPMFANHSSSASTANNSPRASLQFPNLSDSELSQDTYLNALVGADMALNGLFGTTATDISLFGDQYLGPSEALYPFVNVSRNGNVISEDDEYEDDGEDYEDELNLADFMDFGSDEDATDVEKDDETDVPATPATSMIGTNGDAAETPLTRERSASDAMLLHLDRAGVTAFRNNQNLYRDLSGLPHDSQLRASVSRPLRSGKSAETLISPLRRRSGTTKKHVSSPFAGVSKASGRLQSSIMTPSRGPRMGRFS